MMAVYCSGTDFASLACICLCPLIFFFFLFFMYSFMLLIYFHILLAYPPARTWGNNDKKVLLFCVVM